MDPLLVVLLVVFVGLPVLSVVVMAVFTATADFEPEGVEVRGGSLRGAIAAAAAKVLVGDAKTFQLPLVVVLKKVGVFGASTPLLGGATVRDIEWRISVDGEHVSTVTEASSVHVTSRQRVLHLPVNAEVHLPRGLIGTWRKYREDRRTGREVRIEVRGHVIVKHWMMTREMPVRVTRHVVVGAARPRLERDLVPVGPEPANAAELRVRLVNPYRDEVLEERLEVALLLHRRLRRDPALGLHEEVVRLDPGAALVRRFRVMLEPPVRGAVHPEDVVVHEVHPRVRWGDEVVVPDAEDGAKDEGRAPVVRLRAAAVKDVPWTARFVRDEGAA